MVCGGLLEYCCIPSLPEVWVSAAFAGATGHRFISPSCCTMGTASTRDCASGTKATEVWCRAWRNPSQLAKKKVLSFWIGPPTEAPNWFLLKGGAEESASKKLRASNALFRRNSYA